MTIHIKLPANPWVQDDQSGACVARGASDNLALEGPYPQGTGTRRKILEHKFISQFCDHCPIKKFCGEYGRDEEFGIWGGRTEAQRRSDRKIRELLKTI